MGISTSVMSKIVTVSSVQKTDITKIEGKKLMVGKLTPDNIATGSTIAAIMNMNPYKSPNEVLSDAVNGPEPWDGNELTYWGDVHEPVILGEVAKRLNLVKLETEFETAFTHDKLPLACSLDGRASASCFIEHDYSKGIYIMNSVTHPQADDVIILECKTTQASPEDTPPPHRGPLQLQAQMMCTGAKWGAVCVLYRGSTLRIFIYQADLAMQSRISKASHDFQQRVVNVDWYPVTSSEDGNVAYSQVDDAAPPLEVDDADVAHNIEMLVEAKRLKKECEATISEAEAFIKEYMGNHEEAVSEIDGRRFMVKWPMRKTRAQPEKVTPAKPATSVRQNTLTIKELS